MSLLLALIGAVPDPGTQVIGGPKDTRRERDSYPSINRIDSNNAIAVATVLALVAALNGGP